MLRVLLIPKAWMPCMGMALELELMGSVTESELEMEWELEQEAMMGESQSPCHRQQGDLPWMGRRGLLRSRHGGLCHNRWAS